MSKLANVDGDGLGNQLWYYADNGERELNIPYFEYTPLNRDVEEQRFLVLYPTSEDPNGPEDMERSVRCRLETVALADAPPFVALKNSRGYRLLKNLIEVNGKALLISSALEQFLRHFITLLDKPTWVWVRYVSLREFDPEDKDEYWTREWCDKMYSLATDVIDMHEFNAELIDQGKMRKTIDAEYQNWTKEWDGPGDSSKELVLPQVCPVRLGSKPNAQSPTDDYQYVPLDPVTDEIRVILLAPSADRASRLVLHTGHCPIHCEVRYAGVSYQWGTDLEMEEVTITGMKLRIRKTLATILRNMRHGSSVIPLWIDAISINQVDVMERNRQVARMGDIFDTAASVWAYAGPKTEDSDLALELISRLQEPMMRINNNREWHFGGWGSSEDGSGLWYAENEIKPNHLVKMCAALYKFLTRPYFRRAWVLQELAFASAPAIGIGDKWDLGFRKLDHATYNLETMLSYDAGLVGQIMEYDSSLQAVDVRELAFIRKLFYFRHCHSRGTSSGGIRPYSKFSDTAPGFLETLILAREFESTDPRDKVYSLWNLARDKEGLVFSFDYTKSVRDVYLDFAKAWITQHGALDIICAAEASESNTSFHDVAPSWCPDWSTRSTASSLIRRERIPSEMMMTISDLDGRLYSADGGVRREDFLDGTIFSFDGDTLFAMGIILDEINYVIEEPRDIPNGTLFPSGDPWANYKYRCWTEALERYYHNHQLRTYEDPMQAAIAMMHGDSTASWPPREDNLENWDTDEVGEAYVCIPRHRFKESEPGVTYSRHVLNYANSYSRSQARDVVTTVLRGRKPFVTRDGYMGLRPSYLGERDGPYLLAIVAACPVPLILRERDDGSHEMCGTAFVQGLMEGEMLLETMGAESARELWEAMMEVEKLKIR